MYVCVCVCVRVRESAFGFFRGLVPSQVVPLCLASVPMLGHQVHCALLPMLSLTCHAWKVWSQAWQSEQGNTLPYWCSQACAALQRRLWLCRLLLLTLPSRAADRHTAVCGRGHSSL